MTTQRPWQSRTMWVNLVSGFAALASVVGVGDALHLDEATQIKIVGGIMAVVNVVNMYLRPLSTTPITMKPEEDDEPPTGI